MKTKKPPPAVEYGRYTATPVIMRIGGRICQLDIQLLVTTLIEDEPVAPSKPKKGSKK
jgi:hypothetical protein